MISKKILTLACLSTACAVANAGNVLDEDVYLNRQAVESVIESPIQPEYLENAVILNGWTSNWFVGASVGGSVFVGSPIGCDDLFGRLKPLFRINAGKWFSPSVGARAVFEGNKIKSGLLETQTYESYHADLLWNATARPYRCFDERVIDIVPYVGLGVLRNRTVHGNPFAVNYGIMAQYRLTPHLRLTAELGGIATSKRFDGVGKGGVCGDNLFGLSVGISAIIGQSGWGRVVDAAPYQEQNEMLSAALYGMSAYADRLSDIHRKDDRTIRELRKIIRIEGLMNKYGEQMRQLEAAEFPFEEEVSEPFAGQRSQKMPASRGKKGRDRGSINADGSARMQDEMVNPVFSATEIEVESLLDLDGDDICVEGESVEEDSDFSAAEDVAGKASVLEKQRMKDRAQSASILGQQNAAVPGRQPSNNYSGLNSLRERMERKAMEDIECDAFEEIDYTDDELAEIEEAERNSGYDADGSQNAWGEYMAGMRNGGDCIGSPIYFFFNIGTTRLTTEFQLVNLDVLARLAIAHDLKIVIRGAADSATGFPEGNMQLSKDRAEYVASQLRERGVKASAMNVSWEGGVDTLSPEGANRNTMLMLYRN